MRDWGASIATEPGFHMEEWRVKSFAWAILEALRRAQEALDAGEIERARAEIVSAQVDALLVHEGLTYHTGPIEPEPGKGEA